MNIISVSKSRGQRNRYIVNPEAAWRLKEPVRRKDTTSSDNGRVPVRNTDPYKTNSKNKGNPSPRIAPSNELECVGSQPTPSAPSTVVPPQLRPGESYEQFVARLASDGIVPMETQDSRRTRLARELEQAAQSPLMVAAFGSIDAAREVLRNSYL